MSGLGELDRPGTPGSADAWDARSEQWLEGNREAQAETETGTEAAAPGEPSAAGQHGSDDVRGAVARAEARPVGGPGAGPNAGDVPVAVDLAEALSTAGQDAGDARAAVDLAEALPDAGPDAGYVRTALDLGEALPNVGPDADAVRPAVGLAEASSAAGPDAGDVRTAVDLAKAPSVVGQGINADALTTPAPRAPRPSADPGQPHPGTAHAPAPRAVDRKPATPARRGAADPVKALMHRHRELCERAVDPLEIAAGLEAHGVTDRTAARFRHRDVFSLAEEMYARVPRDDAAPAHAGPVTEPAPRATWALLALLPGVLCAATVTGVRLTDGRLRLTVAVVGVLAVALGVRVALSRGPLSNPPGTHAWRTPPGTRLWTYWLLAYALLGDGLLRGTDDGGPDGLPTGLAGGLWPTATAPVLALTLACAPAAWCAHHFAVRARRKLATSRGLEDFADSAQPLLLGTFALFVCALTALLALCGAALDEPAAYAQGITLGALLLLARLLTVHGFTHAPTVALGAAAVTEGTALAVDLIGRLPGCGFLATPVETVLDSLGPGGIPALACGGAALILLFHTTRTLTRASAHAPTNEPR